MFLCHLVAAQSIFLPPNLPPNNYSEGSVNLHATNHVPLTLHKAPLRLSRTLSPLLPVCLAHWNLLTSFVGSIKIKSAHVLNNTYLQLMFFSSHKTVAQNIL